MKRRVFRTENVLWVNFRGRRVIWRGQACGIVRLRPCPKGLPVGAPCQRAGIDQRHTPNNARLYRGRRKEPEKF